MLDISPQQRRALRARAHHLDPVVIVGQHGMTPQVLHEIDRALAAHELVKVRVHNDDRNEREKWLARVCDKLVCAPVQHLGKLLILWRPAEESSQERKPRAAPGKRARKTAKKAQKPTAARVPGRTRSATSRLHGAESAGAPAGAKPKRLHRRRALRAQSWESPGGVSKERGIFTPRGPDRGNQRKRSQATPPEGLPRRRRRRTA